MATLGVLDGTLLVAKIGAASIENLTNVDISETMATRDFTSKDSGDETEIAATRHSWEVTCELFTQYDATYGYSELRTAMMAKTAVSLSWGTFEVGDPEYAGSAIITSVNKSNPLDDNSSVSITFSGTGAITESVTV